MPASTKESSPLLFHLASARFLRQQQKEGTFLTKYHRDNLWASCYYCSSLKSLELGPHSLHWPQDYCLQSSYYYDGSVSSAYRLELIFSIVFRIFEYSSEKDNMVKL